MTIHQEAPSTAGNAGGAVEQVSERAMATAETAAAEVKHVASTATEQFRGLVDEARRDVTAKGDELARRAGERLRGLEDQAQALLDGRPEQAGPLGDLVRDGQRRARDLAARIEERGARGMVDDVVRYGRRRPGMFLLAAAGIGFVTTRLVRVASTATNGERSGGQEQPSPFSDAPQYEPSYAAPDEQATYSTVAGR